MKLIASDGKEYTLDKTETYIGRRSSNDIVLPETRVSGEHAVIRREGDSYVLTDLGSTNGTKVNGQPISAPHTLREGDTIEIGGFTLRFTGAVAEDFVSTQADFDEFDAPRMAAPAAPPAPAASDFDSGFKSAPSASEFDSGFKSTPSSGATPPPASLGAPPPYPAPPAQKKGPNWLLIGGIGCLALICLGAIIAAVVLLVVPAMGGGGVAPGGLFGNQATLTVINQSSDSVCFLYISPTTSDTWGEDRLGSSVLSAGNQQSFNVSAGNYDLRAEMCGGEVVERYDVNLSGTVEWTISD